MNEWQEYELQELCTVQNGYAFRSKQYVEYDSSALEVLKMGHIERGGGLRKEPKRSYVPREEKLKRWILDKGDIVMAMTDMKDNVVILGVPAIVDKDDHYVLNQRVARLKLTSPVANLTFLYNHLKWPEFLYELQSRANSGVQVNLSTSAIKTSIITLPPLEEQEAISAVLSSLDDKIDLLHRQNKTLEALAQTLFRHWFIDGAEDDWEKHKLEDFVEVMRGLSYKGAGLAEESDGVPMHNLNSVYEGGGYKYEGIKYYKGEYKERHKVLPSDIIITNTEQGHDLLLIGYPAVVPRFFGNDGIFSQHIYRLKIFDPRITDQFLYYLLMSWDVREQITGATNGSTVNMLPKDGIEWATFRLPPEIQIERFSEMGQHYWDKKEENFVQIRTLEKLRDTLLPKLMSGEVRVRQN